MSLIGVVSGSLAAAGNLSSLTTLPAGVLVLFVVLAVLELALDVLALVVLVRTPKERVTMPKWGWALLIIFINLIGSILFLAIGRRPPPVVAPPAPGDAAAARLSASSVATALYGEAARPAARDSHSDDTQPDESPTS